MVNRYAALVIAFALSGAANAQEKKLHFVGDFESGLIPAKAAMHDGFYIATLPITQVAGEYLHTGDSNFGPTSNADTRVVSSEVIGGETVRPRSGKYFLRTEVSRTKDYLLLNSGNKNRPRSKIYMSDPAHRVDFDEEGYVGFSIYTPKNFESELAVKDQRGSAMVFELSTDSTAAILNMGVWAQPSDVEAHWYLRIYTDDKSVREDRADFQLVDLGPVSGDMGKWSDFVFRYRFNPFSVTTNPAAAGIPSSMNKVYEGNKGILQVWKAEGPVEGDGNRKMVLKVDKVNTPVGLVPHATEKVRHYWRIYKFGWLSNPTSLTHPVWFGFDEIRQGLVSRDGTTFADVAPAGVPCTTGCGGESAIPNPPTSVAVD
jgi:hypothetical protein